MCCRSQLRLDANQLSGTSVSTLQQLSQLGCGTYSLVRELGGGNAGVAVMTRSCLCCSLLSLASNNITAGDWTTLSSLATLTYLDLHSNRLWGTIPSTVSQLAALTYLDLSSNIISGSIPPTLSSLVQLRYDELERQTHVP